MEQIIFINIIDPVINSKVTLQVNPNLSLDRLYFKIRYDLRLSDTPFKMVDPLNRTIVPEDRNITIRDYFRNTQGIPTLIVETTPTKLTLEPPPPKEIKILVKDTNGRSIFLPFVSNYANADLYAAVKSYFDIPRRQGIRLISGGKIIPENEEPINLRQLFAPGAEGVVYLVYKIMS